MSGHPLSEADTQVIFMTYTKLQMYFFSHLFEVYVSEVSNPSKVRVYGPGVEKGVKTFSPTYFVVDCKEAGPGHYNSSLSLLIFS